MLFGWNRCHLHYLDYSLLFFAPNSDECAIAVVIAFNVLSHHGVLVTHYKTENSSTMVIFLYIVMGAKI